MDVMNLVIWLAVVVIAVVVIWFLLSQMSLPEPIQKIVLIVAVVVFAVIAIGFLLSLRGGLRLSHLSGLPPLTLHVG